MLLIKLHLACGKIHIPGFVHIDLSPMEHVDCRADIRHLDMFDSNSVDLIYASHVLEHFNRWEFRDVLREWYRVLKIGARLRLSVPDFEAYVELYNKQSFRLEELLACFCGGQNDELNYHNMVFDKEFLSEVLIKDIGFARTYLWDWRYTEHSHIDDFSQAYLPHMLKKHGKLMSLNLEAEK